MRGRRNWEGTYRIRSRQTRPRMRRRSARHETNYRCPGRWNRRTMPEGLARRNWSRCDSPGGRSSGTCRHCRVYRGTSGRNDTRVSLPTESPSSVIGRCGLWCLDAWIASAPSARRIRRDLPRRCELTSPRLRKPKFSSMIMVFRPKKYELIVAVLALALPDDRWDSARVGRADFRGRQSGSPLRIHCSPRPYVVDASCPID